MEKEQLKKLHRLSTKEKLELVHMLWDDIAEEQNDIDIPEEHKEMLDARLNKLQKGEAEYKSWEEIRKKYNSG